MYISSRKRIGQDIIRNWNCKFGGKGGGVGVEGRVEFRGKLGKLLLYFLCLLLGNVVVAILSLIS